MALKLTSLQRKKFLAMHIPIKQSVIVPSTKNGDKPITKAKMNTRVSEVRKYLSKNFGGFTSVVGTGGYYSDKKKKLIKEKVVRVVSYSTKKDFRKNKPALLKKLGNWGKKWGQESMGYEHEDDLYYIRQAQALKRRKLKPRPRKLILKRRKLKLKPRPRKLKRLRVKKR